MEELKLMHISVAFLLMPRSSPWGKWASAFSRSPLLHRHHALARQREIRLRGQRFARELILDGQHLDLPACGQCVVNEIQRPSLVRPIRCWKEHTRNPCAGLAFSPPHPTPTSLAPQLFRSLTLSPIRLNSVLRFEKGSFLRFEVGY